MLVLVIAAWFINTLLNSKPAPSPTHNEHELAVEQTKPVNQVGKKLFSDNCANCHALNKDMTGPGLATIEERVPDRKLIYAWIRNNQAVLKSGNEYFNKLYLRWNKTPMNTFPYLLDRDIDAILEYLKQSSGSQPARVAEVRH